MGERCPDQPRMAVVAGKASPAARQGATSQPPVSRCGHALAPEPALWWLRHLLGWLSQRCQASGPQNAFSYRDCALTAPRGCRFGKRPGFCGHGRLWWWHPPSCSWTLRSAGAHSTRPAGNGGCCIPHAACVRSASRSLLAQTLQDRAGVCGKKEIRGNLVLSKSDIVNNGGKQLIRNIFHCVLLKSFVTCVSLLVFRPPCTQLNAGDQQRSSCRVFGCAGGGLWGTNPAASATGVTQPGTRDLPRAVRQGPPDISHRSRFVM